MEDLRIITVPLKEVKDKGTVVINKNGINVLIIYDKGNVYACDIRCPHMGYPLSKGTIRDGILICHWHHARFNLNDGGTFDLWADDLTTYETKIVNDKVIVNFKERDVKDHAVKRLRKGIDHDIDLVIAKSIIDLLNNGISLNDLAKEVSIHVLRDHEWNSGLNIFTIILNLLNYDLELEWRILGLLHGIKNVSSQIFERPKVIYPEPLENADNLKNWFREFIEGREVNPARRAIISMRSEDGLDAMIASVTDHFFLDEGHILDHLNKETELLDKIGWDNSRLIFASLISQLANAMRHEEDPKWRIPDDLVSIINSEISKAQDMKIGKERLDQKEMDNLVNCLLQDDPKKPFECVTQTIASNASPKYLALALGLASAYREARFHTQNDFSDWETVHHQFVYSNALYRLFERKESFYLIRGIYHGVGNLYLTRFLNIPPARLPKEKTSRNEEEIIKSLSEAIGSKRIEEASLDVYDYLIREFPEDTLIKTIIRSLFIEDVSFHTAQTVDAGISLFNALKEYDENYVPMIATVRYLSAHSPTNRRSKITVDVAIKLSKGEALYT
ncbi:Rieske (2Fe-2S) protein [Saccharolobus islandicus]|uniref:Rieske (2Fe-2S) domain protein n=3 Tax=Saccharolobus islandicus TaxID=43080 RepID=M9U6X7_SACIS|nr:Rieske (2Fe-2S) protein [Sulfolobus islandicus]ADX81801.1 Rieske (2Fe-2S) domain-containing protein [Sulfolobus islandicus HVE10/4]ADX84483.1 Rieske (2Fe-2S) domain protein [Sulfolobus islandicus REY15A]AGJ61892.1 Rieske (2Fe-2S) domain protein [Sulfolobus islandicus LAL14/1]WCM36841.1 Rieske 2Fe-2S domain-containing protein [Sulfolobus islandicus]